MSNTERRVGGGFGKQLANSIGGAVRLLRGLRFQESSGPVVARRTVRDSERLQRLKLARKQLEQVVAKLEHDLEELHGTITSGSRAPAGEASGRSLNALMENARLLREKLQEKRLDLVRIDRNIARERQLAGQAAKIGEPSEAPASSETEAPSPRTARAKSPRAQLAQRALRDAPIDRAERALVAGIAEGLSSADEEVRRQAVTKIGERPKPVLSLLVLATNDASERVRLAALGALTGQPHPAVAKVFRRFLRDANPAMRLAALRGLAATKEPVLTKSDLVTTLGDSDATVRRAAADVLSWHGEDAKMGPEVIHALAFALYDEDDAVRASAAAALGTGGDDRAVLALIRTVDDESEAVRAAALGSLRSLVGAEVDTVAPQAPPDKRVQALKLWWRTARVQLRSGAPSSPVEVGSAARDVLQTLASLKKETARTAAEPAPKPAAEPAPKPAPSLGEVGPSVGKPGAVPASAAAREEPPPQPTEEEGDFESVLGPSGEGEESEEYENILDDKGS